MSEPRTTRVRASDDEREQVAALLRTAMGEGRLTLDEGEQRLAAAYAATYRDELPELTADLPPRPPGRPPAGRRGRPRTAAAPVAGLLALGAVLTGIWVVSAGGSLWPVILLGVLAVMLAKHGRRRSGSGAGGRCARAGTVTSGSSASDLGREPGQPV